MKRPAISGWMMAMGVAAGLALAAPSAADRNDLTLYVVGYSHLDSQWRWDYTTTINQYIKDTLDGNFALLEKYPDYVFNFTGAARYEMMKEYYPEQFERVKQYVAQGRWRVSGSSVDECDVLIPSPESVLRQVLYGNRYFGREFGTVSHDFMLPDCFGFPAYLPSLWAHAGLLGFSTQKLSWGSAVGVPFNVGVWEGPDGRGVVAALNCGAYVGEMPERQDLDGEWIGRITENGRASGYYADYRYYGVGDMGGAPREEDVKKAVASLNNADGRIAVRLTGSDQMYRDITPEQRQGLPRYKGELMLTEHSSGATSSQAFMKRMNRYNEQLADAAERAAVVSDWLGAGGYPAGRIERAWWRVLVSQMHDILPGTSIPAAYQYAWNDEFIAANQFAAVLTGAVGGVSRALDTRAQGQPLAVYNPLSIAREDVVTAAVAFAGNPPEAVRVFDPEGREVPAQLLARNGREVRIAFLARVPAVGVSVFDVRPADRSGENATGLKVEGRTLENGCYRVTLNEAGDLASIYDKQAAREVLSRPARLEFHRGTPEYWPAWNMDWNDRQHPATGFVDGPATITVAESGPVRVALKVERTSNNSVFTQTIRLAAGEAGRRVEVYNQVDWQSAATVLKASFPLTVSNPLATYTQGLGTIERPNNHPKHYEYLSHEWFDLTDVAGDYGVSILEDCKFGSDKPADDEVRLTLLYTPGANHGDYQDQLTQDWGRHEFTYALYGHAGGWREALPEHQGRRLNQPLRAFQVAQHEGRLGRSYSMLSLNTDQVDVRAVKKAEADGRIVVRLQELTGRAAEAVALEMGTGIAAAEEIDGQERPLGPATVAGGKLTVAMGPYAIRSFSLQLTDPPVTLDQPVSQSVALECNVTAFSADGAATAGPFGAAGQTMPAEQIPATLVNGDIRFELARPGAGRSDALACQGQTVALPAGEFNRVYLLAAADRDTRAELRLGDQRIPWAVQSWTGKIGQYDRRIWDRPFKAVDYGCRGWLRDIETGFIKRDELAWFSTHRHTASGGNEAYQFSYMYQYGFDLPEKAAVLTLPDNPAIKVFAISVANDENRAMPAADLYDNFDHRPKVELRKKQGDYTGGKLPVGRVMSERAESYETLKLWQPMTGDYADQSTGHGVEFRAVKGPKLAPAMRNGAEVEGVLVRLNDGKVGQNNDDLNNCTFFDDNEARIVADLRQPVSLAEIRTFTWHKLDRAPQKFSLWGTVGDAEPAGDLQAADGAGWTLLATVDTNALGEGGVHATCIVFPKGTVCRRLMWVTDLVGYGMFLNEVDVIATE